MVECSPATRAARVRFPADAIILMLKKSYVDTPLVDWQNVPHFCVMFSTMKKCKIIYLATTDKGLKHFLVSIVVSIPACHAGDRGSIPRRGVLFCCGIFCLSQEVSENSVVS